MKLAEASDQYFMVQYFLIFLVDSARMWLKHHEDGTIKGWNDFKKGIY